MKTRPSAIAGADRRRLCRIAARLLQEAEDGDINAIREIANRLDGRVPQAIGGTGELKPIFHVITGVPQREGE